MQSDPDRRLEQPRIDPSRFDFSPESRFSTMGFLHRPGYRKRVACLYRSPECFARSTRSPSERSYRWLLGYAAEPARNTGSICIRIVGKLRLGEREDSQWSGGYRTY